MSVQALLKPDAPTVECGAALAGSVQWSGNDRHRHVGVVLRYCTQGRGDVDAAVVARCALSTDESGQARFTLPVPASGPVTYNGQLLRVLWQVAVHVPVDRASTRFDAGPAAAQLTVIPQGWTRWVTTGKPPR